MNILPYLNKNTEAKLFTYLFLAEIALLIMVGLETANAFVISILIIFSVAVIVEPFIGLFLAIFLAIGIEGRLIEGFVLFRLFGFNWYLMDLCLLIVFLSISLRVISGAYSIKINNVSIWISVFFFACLIGVYWGLRSGNPTQSIFYDLRGFFYYILFLPAGFLISDYKKLKAIFIFVIVIGTMKCLMDSVTSIFFMERTFDLEIQEYLNFGRLKGYTEVIYPVTFISGIAYFLLTDSLKLKLLFIPVIVISGLALFLSYTRGSWFAAFLAIMVALILLTITKRIKVSYFNIIIGAVIFSILVFILDFFNIFTVKGLLGRVTSVSLSRIDISNLGRLVEFATALEAFFRNPILGAGLGFKFNYFSPGIGYLSTEYCHNSYLYVMAKMGIIGLIPFLMILFSSFQVGYKILLKNIKDEEAKLVFIFTVILIMISIKSFTTWHLNTLTFSPFVGILFGINYSYKNKIKTLSDK